MSLNSYSTAVLTLIIDVLNCLFGSVELTLKTERLDTVLNSTQDLRRYSAGTVYNHAIE